jgi:hypothetical protein
MCEGAFGGWFDMVLSLCKLAMDMFNELHFPSTNLCVCVCVSVHFTERNQEKGDIGYVLHQEKIGCLELKWATTKQWCSSFYGLLKHTYFGSNVSEENLLLWLLESLRVKQGDVILMAKGSCKKEIDSMNKEMSSNQSIKAL